MTSSIDSVLQNAVSSGAVPNAVAMAGDRDGVVYEGAAGPRVAGQDDPVGPDTMFRIASMTKMVATVAALQQVERGKISLDDPVEKHLPDFAKVQVLDGFDGDQPRTRAPKSKATVHHLVTHTSGLGYWFFNQDILRWEQATGTPNVLSGSNAIFSAPMTADPGTKYEYGTNIDWLGRVVESSSGQSFDDYLKDNIFAPLGMDDTTFIMSEQQRANSTPIHVQGEDGSWTPTDIDWNQQPDWWAGGHGLYSTPRNYLRFQRMLLNDGTLDGAKILEKSTVDKAFSNQIGELDFPAEIASADPQSSFDFNAGPGFKWGYGLLLNTAQQAGMRAPYSGAWAGLFNTHFWVDRASGVTGAIYTQLLPFVLPSAFQMYVDFEKVLYGSMAKA